MRFCGTYVFTEVDGRREGDGVALGLKGHDEEYRFLRDIRRIGANKLDLTVVRIICSGGTAAFYDSDVLHARRDCKFALEGSKVNASLHSRCQGDSAVLRYRVGEVKDIGSRIQGVFCGHRLVGGMRASIYNAMPIEGIEALIAFMKKFEAENK